MARTIRAGEGEICEGSTSVTDHSATAFTPGRDFNLFFPAHLRIVAAMTTDRHILTVPASQRVLPLAGLLLLLSRL